MEPKDKKEWERLRDMYILGRLGGEQREALRRYLREHPGAGEDLRLHATLRRTVEDLAGKEEYAPLFARMAGREAAGVVLFSQEADSGEMPAPSQSVISAGRLKEIFVEEEGAMNSGRRKGAVVRSLNPSGRSRWWIPAVAAAVLLLAVAVPVLLNRSSAGVADPVALFDQYYERPAAGGNLAPAGQGDSLARRWSEAVLAYGNGDCDRFLELSAGLAGAAGFGDAAAARLYAGVCLLGQRRGADAIAELEQVPQQALGLYRQSRWYLGLAYLQQKDTEKAKIILQEIAADPAYTEQGKAKEILKQL